MAKSDSRNFLTVYTASKCDILPGWPIIHSVLGSWIRRGDALRELADEIIEKMDNDPCFSDLFQSDEDVWNFLVEEIGIPVVGGKIHMFHMTDADRDKLRSHLIDRLGGDGCFVVKGDVGMYRFDVDENDVECDDGLHLWTCITTGIDNENHDPEWEQAFPEVFLNEEDAVNCALNDLLSCMDGYEDDEKDKELKDARYSIEKRGYYEFNLNDMKSRRWDVWSTPLDIGDGRAHIMRHSNGD